MAKLHWDEAFKKIYRKKTVRNHELAQKFGEAIIQLTHNPFDPRLRTHKLTGKLKNLWAFSCGYDCRVVFRFLDDSNILLIDIGSHDEVY